MKKKITAMTMGVLVFTLVSGTAVFAAEITADDAAKTALGNAGVSETDAAIYKNVWEFSDGREKYDINFLIPGQVKYDYDIDAVTGDVLQSEQEAWEAEDDFEYKGLTPGNTADPEETAGALEEAVLTAIKDAGVNEGEAVVYKAGTDFENGREVFSVNFFIAGQTKFDYDIDAKTGEILTREQEAWEPEDDMEYAGLIEPKAAAEKAAPTGALTDADAVAIALKDAGLSEGDVTITECYKEMDDGIEQYNVSFIASGTEYDYDIDATAGTILSKDMEAMEYDD